MKRPFSVTILLWLVLILTVWSGLRLVTAFQWWQVLIELAAPPGPIYIAISGGVWLIAGLVLFWGMWRGKAWIRYALLGTGAGFSAWYWCDRLFLQMPSENWLFSLTATVLLLIIVSVCIFIPSTKNFFSTREVHD